MFWQTGNSTVSVFQYSNENLSNNLCRYFRILQKLNKVNIELHPSFVSLLVMKFVNKKKQILYVFLQSFLDDGFRQ